MSLAQRSRQCRGKEAPAVDVEEAAAEQQPAADTAASDPDESASDEVVENLEMTQPSHYWTWRLLAAGFTPEECATIRSLSAEVVLDHALRAADAGLAIDPLWFLAPELIARIERVIGPGSPTRIRPLLERLPRGTRYEEVQLVLKSRRTPTKPP